MIIQNSNRRISMACAGIVVMGVIMLFLPGIIGMDGFNGGYALTLFGACVAILGLISVILFARMAVLQDRILKKENILAHWTYSEQDWRQYVEKEHVADKTDKRSLFLLVAVISVVIGIIFWFIYPDARLVTLLTILGIIGVIGVTAFLSSSAVYAWNKKHRGEIYIAKDGAYFSGRLHIWKGMGTSLEKIQYLPDRNPGGIMVKYSSLNFLTGNRYTVRIPVPAGQEEAASQIADQIKIIHSSG